MTLTLRVSPGGRYGRENVTGWLADFFRFAWALTYWNLRKTVFRLRRGRGGHCPCQNPSDSGRAGETGCDAVLGWRRPERFRRVCPLLKPGADGVLRCSVNAAEVRPFWGRALAIYGGMAVALYLATTLAAFAGLRAIGYRVSYVAVAWPPAWNQIDDARAVYFRDKARHAYAAKNVHEAILSLSLAYELDPRHYPTGLLLAQLWQTGQPVLSNRVYVRLLRDHPERWSGTAQGWFRALLARGDYAAVSHLSAEGVQRDPEHALAWAHALVFATRRTDDLGPLQSALERETLAPAVRTVLALEQNVRTAPAAEARAALQAGTTADGRAVGLFRARRLIELGLAAEALDLLDRFGAPPDDRDALSVRLDAYARLGYMRPRRNLAAALLRGPLTPAIAEVLAAHLIRYPSPSLYEDLFAKLERSPPAQTAESYSLYLTLYCLAGAYGDAARLHAAAAELKRIVGSDFAALAAVERFFLRKTPDARIEAYLPVLQPLSLEVTYALLERFAPASAASRLP